METTSQQTTPPQRTQRSIDQKLAESQQRTARLLAAKRKLCNGQKIIMGGVMFALAERDEKVRKQCVTWLEENVKREADLRRIRPLLDELRSK